MVESQTQNSNSSLMVTAPSDMTRHPAVAARFSQLLDERLRLGGKPTEDTIRYTFFHALTTVGEYQHWSVDLEFPLPRHKARLIDTVVRGADGAPTLVVEFKYHRARATTLPKPQLAGGIVSDLFRLAVAHETWGCDCYLVYVTDSVMATYLKQPRHGCRDLLFSPVGEAVPLGEQSLVLKSKTFVKALNGFMSNAIVSCISATELPHSYEVRVFKVSHALRDLDRR